uniref:ABC transporter efflux protein n=1 Tax=Chlorobium chlorochromatii (strain CaD3) TaxID=340177 RepID=Q3ARX2_CHLCH
MLFREIIQQALLSLSVNKLRSGLTIMGVAVGVFSIIAVMTALDAIDASIESGLSSLGASTFQMQKNPPTTLGRAHGRNLYANRRDISWQEAQRFKKEMEGKSKTVGLVIQSKAHQANYGNLSTNPDVSLVGGDEHFALANGYTIAEGRNVVESDIRSQRNVVVLGSEVAATLFPAGNSALQKKIRLNGEVLTVIGVFAKKGSAFGQSQDNMALLPITRYLSHINEKSSIAITVEATSQADYARTMDRAIGAMRLARGLTIQQSNDFEILSNESLLDSFRDIKQAVTTGAFLISMTALLTAGVGIMNIMLVSVTERTREIGIRKSVGAPRTSILRQFLLEALFLSLAGGAIGIVTGLGAGNLVALQFNLPPLFPWLWIMIALVVCSTVGIAFGIFPAWKAATLNPVDALRRR